MSGEPAEALGRVSTEPRFQDTRRILATLQEAISSLSFSSEDLQKVSEAQKLMLVVHIDQKDRPDGQPYVSHPPAVTNTAIVKFGLRSVEGIIAGLLHDAVEDRSALVIKALGGKPDTGSNLEAEALRLIGARFGARVSQMVGHLTNPNFDELALHAQMKGDQRDTAIIKNEYYKEHFLGILEKDPEAFLIKLADFSENALSVGKLPEGPKKVKLRAKYGPVILALEKLLQDVPDFGNELSAVKTHLLEKLRESYKRDYRQNS